MTLDINVKLDTGRRLARSAGSRPLFFRRGDITARFSDEDNVPFACDAFTMSVRYVNSKSMSLLTYQKVGIGSSVHDLTGELRLVYMDGTTSVLMLPEQTLVAVTVRWCSIE